MRLWPWAARALKSCSVSMGVISVGSLIDAVRDDTVRGTGKQRSAAPIEPDQGRCAGSGRRSAATPGPGSPVVRTFDLFARDEHRVSVAAGGGPEVRGANGPLTDLRQGQTTFPLIRPAINNRRVPNSAVLPCHCLPMLLNAWVPP